MAILAPGHTSSCRAPSPTRSCSPPYEYAPQVCCVAFPVCQPTRPLWFVLESRSILPQSRPTMPSSVSLSSFQTGCSVTRERHRPSCLQQSPCATPLSCPPCPGLSVVL